MPGSSPELDTPVDLSAEPQISDASAAADSSSAEQQGEKSLLESVQAALQEGEKETSPDSGPDPKSEDAPKAAATTADPDEPLGEMTPEELKTYAPKTQRRMQQLLAQRHEFESRATAAEEKATRFDQIAGFMESNRLNNEDMTVIFEIGALCRNDPEKAYDKVLPIFLHLSELTGKVLPREMQEKVDLGYLPQSDAQELVRLKNRAAITEQQRAEQQREAAEQAERQANEARVAEVASAAEQWETRQQKSDPDWSSKKDLVLSVMQAELAQTGYPTDKAAILAVLDSSLAKVDAQIARFRPAPRAVTPVTGSSSTGASAEPKSAMEAARMALSGA